MTRPLVLFPALVLTPLLLIGCATNDDPLDAWLGDWAMATEMGGNQVPARLTLERGEGDHVDGAWASRGMDMSLDDVTIMATAISFEREIPGGQRLRYEGELVDGRLVGAWTGPFGELPCSGERSEASDGASDGASTRPAAPQMSGAHDRPIEERDGRRYLWAGDEGGTDQWFDMTDSLIDPATFQFGIGKDTIPSIDAPEFVNADDPRLAERGVEGTTDVLGVYLNGEARAYPVNVMSMHEVVNDNFGGEAFAVLW